MQIIDVLIAYPVIWISFIAMLGLLVGSFLNVVIYRLPIMMQNEWQQQCAELNQKEVVEQPVFNLSVPRSTCPHCGHTITAIENIPVISYLFLKGRCLECQAPISIRYPAVETLTAVLSALIAWQFGCTVEAVGAILLTWALIALCFIDIDQQLLPDTITLPLVWLGLLFNLFEVYVPLQESVIGAMAGYLSLWSVYHVFRLLTGKEGMGYGDFKLLAALGAWLGWQSLPLIILVSSFVGAVIGISLILLRLHQRSNPIPFGPYLAIAGWIMLVWGAEINQAYLKLSGLG